MSLERQLADYGQRLRQAITDLEVPMELGHAVRPVPEEAPTHRRRRLIAATAGVAALAAVALAVLFWPGGGESAPFVDEGSTVPGTTLAVPTTVAPVMPEIVAAPIPAEGALLVLESPLVAVSAGEVWTFIGTEDPLGLIGHLKDGAWSYWRLTDDRTFVGGLAVAPDGTVWAATGSGVFSFDGEEWTRRFDDPAGGVTVSQDGTLWIGGPLDRDWFTAPFWLARWDGASFARVDPWPLDPPRGSVVAMAAAPGGEVWIASTGYIQSDLMRFDGQTMEAAQIGDYQDTSPDSAVGPVGVFDIEVAPNGDLWVGGFGAADWDQVVLARYDGAEWTLYDWPFADSSEEGEVLFFDLAVGPDGVVRVGFPGGLGSFDGEDWTRIEGIGFVWSVDVAPAGTVWYGDDEGVHTLP
jgi:hypothetical protein